MTSQMASKIQLKVKSPTSTAKPTEIAKLTETSNLQGLITNDGFDLSVLTDKDLTVFLDVLVRYIYSNIALYSVEYEGKTYFNRSTQWYFRPKGVAESHDINYTCWGYRECQSGIPDYCDESDLCRPDDFDPDELDIYEPSVLIHSHRLKIGDDDINIKYNLKWSQDSDDSKLYDDCELHSEFYNLIIATLKGKSLQALKLTYGDKSFRFVNPSGVNDDHRGSDHTKIVLDFHTNYLLDVNPTLEQFAEACYRIKSHKFDYNYEMYCGVSTICDFNSLTMNFSFDHGS
jgi:hypothetical protein